MRKLATIRRIADIQPIEGADAIECVTIDGWKVVAQKSMGYRVGGLVIYFEIDSWIPHKLAPFLTKNAAIPRQFNGVDGERLRTIKLRGQVSQGLLMPLNVLWCGPHINEPFMGVCPFDPQGEWIRPSELDEDGFALDDSFDKADDLVETDILVDGEWTRGTIEGLDVSERLGVQKWEAPISPQMQGQAKGTFPTQYASKTDQERIQNMWREVYTRRNELFEWTLKLDGSSMTVFRIDGELRVASRNLELKIAPENLENAYVKLALDVGQRIADYEGDIVIQGELMGPGVQGNRENLHDLKFFVFEIVDPKTRLKWNAETRTRFVVKHGLSHVPVLGSYRELPFESVQDALDLADSLGSINHKIAEGVVFKSITDPEFSFKVISNRFLIREQ